MDRTRKGVLVSMASGTITAHALASLEARGTLFVSPGEEVRKGGMGVGEVIAALAGIRMPVSAPALLSLSMPVSMPVSIVLVFVYVVLCVLSLLLSVSRCMPVMLCVVGPIPSHFFVSVVLP